MTEAKKYTIKCSVEGCNELYCSRGLCRRHYKQLLGREGGYAREYSLRKNKDGYKKMKLESDKKYRERLKEKGLYSEKQKEYYQKYVSEKENLDNRRKRNREYYRKNKELVLAKNAAHARRRRDEIKLQVLTHYSNGKLECANCGMPVYSLLTLDHINNDGGEHRRSLSPSGKPHSGAVYVDIVKRNYPPGFQVLCFNCNFFKEIMRRLK